MKLFLAILLLGAGGAFAQAVAPDTVSAPAPYMQVRYTDDRLAELQIALRKMTPEKKDQPVIWLVGVAHIGEPAYYRKLQKFLNKCDLVLYEGVGDSPRKMREAEDPASASLQGDLADALDLVFQLRAIDYAPEHFRNSDTSMEGLKDLMEKAARESEAGEQASEELNRLLATMQGGGLMSGLVDGLMVWLKNSPQLKNMVKLMFIEMLGNIKGDMGAARMPPEMQKLMELLIDERNKVVMQDLGKEWRKPEPPGSIAVFYGAAHMHDLEERIAERGYRPGKDRWLTAISLDIKEAGIRKQDVLLIRRMVKMQLDALK